MGFFVNILYNTYYFIQEGKVVHFSGRQEKIVRRKISNFLYLFGVVLGLILGVVLAVYVDFLMPIELPAWRILLSGIIFAIVMTVVVMLFGFAAIFVSGEPKTE